MFTLSLFEFRAQIQKHTLLKLAQASDLDMLKLIRNF